MRGTVKKACIFDLDGTIVDSIAEQETDDNCRPLRDVVILKIEEE